MTEAPFAWNVAGLLADAVGSHRDLEIHDARIALPDELSLAEPVDGHVRLARTNRGILAEAHLTTALAEECSRCLRPATAPLELAILEEYLPTIDLLTGAPLSITEEPDALRLDEHHELDLEPSVRDAISLAEPIVPLCRADCPGLCVACGIPLDEGTHDHPDDDLDPRFAVFRELARDASDLGDEAGLPSDDQADS